MISQSIKEQFTTIKTAEAIWDYIGWVTVHMSQLHYYTHIIKEHSTDTITIFSIKLTPYSDSHHVTYLQMYFYFDNNTLLWQKNRLEYQNVYSYTSYRQDVHDYIYEYLDQLVYVPPLKVSGNTVTLGEKSIKYNSKTQMKKMVVPQLARHIVAPFDWTEKCALAHNLLRKNCKIDNFNKYIESHLHNQIRNFLFSFRGVENLNNEDFLFYFKDFYNFPSQYILYKF
jgi:hypothetical protein